MMVGKSGEIREKKEEKGKEIFLDEPCTSPGGTWTKDMIVSLWKHSGTISQR